MKDSFKLMVVSFILVGIGAFIYINALGDGITYFSFWSASLVGGGVWAFLTAVKMKDDSERYKKYISIIVNQNQTSIENIASAFGVTYEAVEKDLQKMIDLGYLVGAYINVSQREIVLAKPASPNESGSTVSSSTPIQERIIACGSCGANNRVTGQLGECEYCGSHLQ